VREAWLGHHGRLKAYLNAADKCREGTDRRDRPHGTRAPVNHRGGGETAGGVPSTVVSPFVKLWDLRQVKSDLRIYPRSVLRLLLFVDHAIVCGEVNPRPLRMAASASGTL
jgi:hypothetical protein